MTTQDKWLPNNYEKPKNNSSYFKFEEGDNKFRIMSSPIIGWVDWKEESDGTRKPVRTKEKPETLFNPKKPAKHFWAFIVLDRKDNRVKVMEVTQSGIQDGILSYQSDESWGNPTKYDLNIYRTGKDIETKYTVKSYPHTEIGKDAVEAYEKAGIDLNALFTGSDPFETSPAQRMQQGMNSTAEIPEEMKKITVDDPVTPITNEQVDNFNPHNDDVKIENIPF